MKKFPILKNPFLLTGTMAVLAVLIVGQVLTLSQLRKQQTNQGNAQVVQWNVSQSASSSCPADGKAIISVSFTNQETSKDINVTAKDSQTGKTVDLGTIKAGTTKTGQIATQLTTLTSGSVLFVLTWTSGASGTDSRTANYSAVQCAQPSATPTPTYIAPSLTPTPTYVYPSPTPTYAYPTPTPTTAVVPTLYCMGSCPTTAPTATPYIYPSPTSTPYVYATPTPTPYVYASPTPVPYEAATPTLYYYLSPTPVYVYPTPTAIISYAPTQAPCTTAQSVAVQNKNSMHKNTGNGLVGDLLKLINKLGNGGGYGNTPTPYPTPGYTNPCPSETAVPSTAVTQSPTTSLTLGPTAVPVTSSPSTAPAPIPANGNFLQQLLAFFFKLIQVILNLFLSLGKH